jgi:hypothetical protein
MNATAKGRANRRNFDLGNLHDVRDVCQISRDAACGAFAAACQSRQLEGADSATPPCCAALDRCTSTCSERAHRAPRTPYTSIDI